MIIVGIDPGTRVTGYAIIEVKSTLYHALDYGCIRPPTNLKLTDRYFIIFNAIQELLEKCQPDALVIETQYVHKNVQSAIKLGMARGIVTIAAKQKNLAVYEYSPTKIKRAVVGKGNASKYQVQGMTQKLLKLSKRPEPEDAADALAIAICHAHAISTKRNIGIEI